MSNKGTQEWSLKTGTGFSTCQQNGLDLRVCSYAAERCQRSSMTTSSIASAVTQQVGEDEAQDAGEGWAHNLLSSEVGLGSPGDAAVWEPRQAEGQTDTRRGSKVVTDVATDGPAGPTALLKYPWPAVDQLMHHRSSN